ncbi:MAG: glycosyltransferase family 2 protein [Nitrosomonadaceae bacterium]|nr:glycosyltransferase family 2 protein [Nitrosomonadaceae bacterium]
MDPLFDWRYYLAKYEDLRGIVTEEEALQHWNDHGKHESRNSYGVKLFTMVKDEADIVREWILYHGNLFGYEHLYIVDNGSTDGTLEIIQSFAQTGIHIFHEADYRKKGDVMTALIREHSPRGIAYPIDIDEFVVHYDKATKTVSADKETIMKYLYSLPISTVYKTNYILSCVETSSGYVNAVLEANTGYYLDYGTMAKSFFTASLFTGTVDHGNHYPFESFIMTDLCLVHYHCRNRTQMHTKILNNVSGLGYDTKDLQSLKNLPKDCQGFHHVESLIAILEGSYQFPPFNVSFPPLTCDSSSDQTIHLTPLSDAMRALI